MADSSALGNIRGLPELGETRSEQVARPLLHRTAELRDETTWLAETAADLHAGEVEAELERTASLLAQADPSELLHRLGTELGFSWTTVANLLRVTPTAIRKWRRGEAMTAENRAQLAKLVAFCEALPRAHPLIADPALWLEMPVTTETAITHGQLFSRGLSYQLLDLAGQRKTPQQLLDEAEPGWRTHHPSDRRWSVVTAEDGLPSIVPKE